MNYKDNITSLPEYKDGCFFLYEIKQTDESYPREYLHLISNIPFWFEERSISNNLKIESDARELNLTMRIRIPQSKQITSMNVLKIGESYHKVYNAFHFTNENCIKQTDLTLQNYENPLLEKLEEKNSE